MQTETVKQLPGDPVIEWLKACRDFQGATLGSREMAQRAIDRLSGAEEQTPAEVIDELLASLGTWKVTNQGVVSDRPLPGAMLGASADDVGYYGGYLLGETMCRTVRILMSHLPQLLQACRFTEAGRQELFAIARELRAAAPARRDIKSRFDAAAELATLADDMGYADQYGAGEVLRLLAVAVFNRKVPELSAALRAELGMRPRL